MVNLNIDKALHPAKQQQALPQIMLQFQAIQLQTPINFSFCSKCWTRWSKRWERYRSGRGLFTDEEHVNQFLYIICNKVEDLLLAFSLSEKYATLKQKFVEYFGVRVNVPVLSSWKGYVSSSSSRKKWRQSLIINKINIASRCSYGAMK
ncbi:hypothetical protein J437_LFUL014639 [Ladona fulva]|uniref:Uncharacterized protein n=1 Tax=Ladona fulva TaxID=123851 RepID=A0A8K0KGB4_LADFU|nr:hypothetical protein J437_LFUL014639 [Ladona fulva]